MTELLRPQVNHARSRVWLPAALIAVDVLVIVLATVVALAFRLSLPIFASAKDLDETLQTSAVLIVTAWIMLLAVFGSYRHRFLGAGSEEYRAVVNASAATAAIVGVGCYLVSFPLSRGFFVLLFLVGIPALLLARLGMRRTLQRLRSRGLLTQRVLIVANPSHADEVVDVLRREAWLGYSVIGCLVPSGPMAETRSGIPVMGNVEHLNDLVAIQQPDIVFFGNGAFQSSEELRQAAWDLEELGNLQIIVAPNLTEVSSERVLVRPVAGLPLVHLEAPRWQHAGAWLKRTFDLALTVVLLILAAPLFAALALWIKTHDGGPVLFSQTRVGRDGKTFSCLKFRSMVVDAEQLLPEVSTHHEEDHVLFKSRQDPRVTRPGRFMRRLSLDELPQLFNVLHGDMSLVGPRPPLPAEVELYHKAMHRRLNVRPGLTGLWQVSGRADLSWAETVRLDLYYVDNWSMVQDLTILLRTVRAVLGGRGAY